jgi:hypothetical protein
MGTTIPRQFNFARGANTTAAEHTSAFPIYPVLDEIEVDRVVARRRRGKVAIHTFTVTSDLIEFDAVNDLVTPYLDTRIIPLGVRWSMETAFVTTSVAADRCVIGRGGASAAWIKVVHNTSSEVVVTLTDSAGNTATMTWTGVAAGTVCFLQVTRNGTAVTGSLNGTAKTATLASATNLMANAAWVIGADNAGSFFLGRVDYVRGFSTLKTTTRDLRFRLLDPRAPGVLFDYVVAKDANNKVIDCGVYEAHAAVTGTPTTAGAPLVANPDPVRVIAANLDTDNAPQGYVMVRNRVFPVRF